MELFASNPGDPVPSVLMDLVRGLKGYEPMHSMHAARNDPRLKIPTSEVTELVDRDEFYSYVRRLSRSACSCPLLLEMIKGPGPARSPPSIKLCVEAYKPDDILDGIVSGTVNQLGHRVPAYCNYDDDQYGRAMLAGWRHVEGYKQAGSKRGNVQESVATTLNVRKADIDNTNTPRAKARPPSLRPIRAISFAGDRTASANTFEVLADEESEDKTDDQPAMSTPENATKRKLRNKTRAAYYVEFKTEMLNELYHLIKYRRREWRAANRALYMLITDSVKETEQNEALPTDKVPFGDGVKCFEFLRQHCMGEDGSADTWVNKLMALLEVKPLAQCTDYSMYRQPLMYAKQALDAIVDPNMSYADFIQKVILVLMIHQVKSTAKYAPLLSTILTTTDLTEGKLGTLVRGWEKNPMFGKLRGPANDDIQGNSGEYEDKSKKKKYEKNKKKTVFSRHPRSTQDVDICNFWHNKEVCVKQDCKYRHHLVRAEYEPVQAAVKLAARSADVQANSAKSANSTNANLPPPPNGAGQGQWVTVPPHFNPVRSNLSQGYFGNGNDDDNASVSSQQSGQIRERANSSGSSQGNAGHMYWMPHNCGAAVDLMDPAAMLTNIEAKAALYDSGANLSIVNKALANTRAMPKPKPVRFGNGQKSIVTHFTSQGLIKDAVIHANSPDTLVSVGRQADQGRPSVMTKWGAWHVPEEMAVQMVKDPRSVQVAVRDNTTNGMYNCINEVFGLLALRQHRCTCSRCGYSRSTSLAYRKIKG
jgi:hypothetical protein